MHGCMEEIKMSYGEIKEDRTVLSKKRRACERRKELAIQCDRNFKWRETKQKKKEEKICQDSR